MRQKDFVTGVLAVVLVLAGMAGMCQAAEGDVDVDVTWVSKYIWRGIDRLDDKAAIQPSATYDLGNGFSAGIKGSIPGASGSSTLSTVNAEEWDYIVSYSNSVYEGMDCKMDYALSWIYYDFPDQPSDAADAQEFNLAMSWPDICPFGTVPSYTIVKMWPAEGGGASREMGGFIHVVGLGYDFSVPGFTAGTPEQTISFACNATYNDGTGLGNGSVDHDWSHILWGLSTDFECGVGTLTPGIFYQTSMDDSVNTEDEFWTGISYSMGF